MNPEQLAKSGTEHAEQMALFCWAAKAQFAGFAEANSMSSYDAPFDPTDRTPLRPVPGLRFLHAIPNAGARGNKVAASQLKAEGVKAGVADILLPMTRQFPVMAAGLYVEMKREKGNASDVSNEQIEFAKFVTSQGYAWYPAFGWREAARIIESYIQCETPILTPKQKQVFHFLSVV